MYLGEQEEKVLTLTRSLPRYLQQPELNWAKAETWDWDPKNPKASITVCNGLH